MGRKGIDETFHSSRYISYLKLAFVDATIASDEGGGGLFVLLNYKCIGRVDLSRRRAAMEKCIEASHPNDGRFHKYYGKIKKFLSVTFPLFWRCHEHRPERERASIVPHPPLRERAFPAPPPEPTTQLPITPVNHSPFHRHPEDVRWSCVYLLVPQHQHFFTELHFQGYGHGSPLFFSF